MQGTESKLLRCLIFVNRSKQKWSGAGLVLVATVGPLDTPEIMVSAMITDTKAMHSGLREQQGAGCWHGFYRASAEDTQTAQD